MKERDIDIVSIVGGPLCLSSDDGAKVHDAIVAALKKGEKVRLSFRAVEDLTSAFLNAAIGQLYGEFDEEELRNRMLPPVNTSSADLSLLKRVVDRAKEFFKNPERQRQIMRDILGEQDE